MAPPQTQHRLQYSGYVRMINRFLLANDVFRAHIDLPEVTAISLNDSLSSSVQLTMRGNVVVEGRSHFTVIFVGY